MLSLLDASCVVCFIIAVEEQCAGWYPRQYYDEITLTLCHKLYSTGDWQRLAERDESLVLDAVRSVHTMINESIKWLSGPSN